VGLAAESVNPWNLQLPIAELRCGVLSGRVDVSQPGIGLHSLAINGESYHAQLLCVGQIVNNDAPVSPSAPPDDTHVSRVVGAWPVADAYVRSGDLVAMYEPANGWPYTTQIYWRANPSDSANDVLSSLSLLVSLQTHLLDTWPKLAVDSRLAADDVVYLACDSAKRASTQPIGRGRHTLRPMSPCCILRRLAGAPISYAEIMPAGDVREVTIWHGAEGVCRTRWELFSEFLEKGVIRRARMLSVVLPRENDTENALALCEAIERRPLPLTT
jgi:hypothetical protein